jgi:thiol:disulfide interchange protein DsbD
VLALCFPTGSGRNALDRAGTFELSQNHPPMTTQRDGACRRMRSTGRVWVLWLCVVLLAMSSRARAADDFLEPEQAFRVSAQMVSAERAEVIVQVAPGYYLYREPFRFAVQGAVLATPEIPRGKVKFDENFQKDVETYRGQLRIGLPLNQVSGPFTLRVVTQGCADAGLCYPPMTTQLRLDPAVLQSPASQGPVAPTAAAAAAAPARSSVTAWFDGAIVGEVLQAGRLWRVVGVFFAMGLLLSFTPCVLPMLPILSSLIVGTQTRPTRMRGLALAGSYSLGMALVYTTLGVAAGLAGEGFAAALQTPWAIGGFAVLLAIFALSMFDVYELRLPTGVTSNLTSQCYALPAGQVAGVFMMGGVSALIVSPCVTAPLAGALLFISQSRDVMLGGAALFAMAIGMSVPLLVLGVSSGRWLPKSGVWMHAVKRLFGVAMLGVAIWVAQPVLPIAVVLALWGLLLLLLAYMLRPFSSHGHRRHAMRIWLQRALGVAALVFGVMEIVGAASGGHDPLQPLAHFGDTAASARDAPRFAVVRSSAELDQALRSAGRPVVLDFYADWCVSCKEMERFTFNDADVASRLGQALLLKADVTQNTEADRELLRRFKLFGPPGTLFFDAQGREVISARVVGFQGPRRFAKSLVTAGL